MVAVTTTPTVYWELSLDFREGELVFTAGLFRTPEEGLDYMNQIFSYNNNNNQIRATATEDSRKYFMDVTREKVLELYNHIYEVTDICSRPESANYHYTLCLEKMTSERSFIYNTLPTADQIISDY